MCWLLDAVAAGAAASYIVHQQLKQSLDEVINHMYDSDQVPAR